MKHGVELTPESAADIHDKLVRESRPWWYRALGNTARPVHFRSLNLVDAMEMETAGLVPQVVCKVDHHCVPHRCLNLWAWPLIVDADNWSPITIWTRPHPGGSPVVGDGGCPGDAGQRQECKR